MKIGIDSYCYHRFFGEVYPQQRPPPRAMSMEDFLKRAKALQVDGVSLESCFFPEFSSQYLGELKAVLDSCQFERVFAWGHPDGLEGGTNEAAYAEMIRSLKHAQAIGAKVMRVVGSSLAFRHQPHAPQIERLIRMFKKAIEAAEEVGIRLAVENHIDFTADEILGLLEGVNSPWLGLNFDTGNFLRLLDDPIKGMRKLAKYVYATHIKDLKPRKGVSADEWFFFSCTPVGDGLVDNQQLAELLHQVHYQGFLAVEIDFLHPDYQDNEDAAVEKSVIELRRIAGKFN
ncbi:MAG: sugar phosphate isomerase/epimerase [Candidatus Omnitrophica bacterium]|nr:sugar phosphate isomerase/epimerase [Candidatus Omnitrophota bacterium]